MSSAPKCFSGFSCSDGKLLMFSPTYWKATLPGYAVEVYLCWTCMTMWDESRLPAYMSDRRIPFYVFMLSFLVRALLLAQVSWMQCMWPNSVVQSWRKPLAILMFLKLMSIATFYAFVVWLSGSCEYKHFGEQHFEESAYLNGFSKFEVVCKDGLTNPPLTEELRLYGPFELISLIAEFFFPFYVIYLIWKIFDSGFFVIDITLDMFDAMNYLSMFFACHDVFYFVTKSRTRLSVSIAIFLLSYAASASSLLLEAFDNVYHRREFMPGITGLTICKETGKVKRIDRKVGNVKTGWIIVGIDDEAFDGDMLSGTEKKIDVEADCSEMEVLWEVKATTTVVFAQERIGWRTEAAISAVCTEIPFLACRMFLLVHGFEAASRLFIVKNIVCLFEDAMILYTGDGNNCATKLIWNSSVGNSILSAFGIPLEEVFHDELFEDSDSDEESACDEEYDEEAAKHQELYLCFTDTDEDIILIRRDGAFVKEYVNGHLTLKNMKYLHINTEARTYQDAAGHGEFKSTEDLEQLVRKRDAIFNVGQANHGCQDDDDDLSCLSYDVGDGEHDTDSGVSYAKEVCVDLAELDTDDSIDHGEDEHGNLDLSETDKDCAPDNCLRSEGPASSSGV